jgi:hypothetical protein
MGQTGSILRGPMKHFLMIMLALGTHALIITARADAAYVSERIFNEKFDKAHAKCANADLSFSSEFHWCLNRELEYI